MIKIENIDIYGWEAAIRGMRNPMNSWEKSDSGFTCRGLDAHYTILGKMVSVEDEDELAVVGPNDLDLMTRLVKGGPVHAKFRRMINVTMDITAPLYW